MFIFFSGLFVFLMNFMSMWFDYAKVWNMTTNKQKIGASGFIESQSPLKENNYEDELCMYDFGPTKLVMNVIIELR